MKQSAHELSHLIKPWRETFLERQDYQRTASTLLATKGSCDKSGLLNTMLQAKRENTLGYLFDKFEVVVLHHTTL